MKSMLNLTFFAFLVMQGGLAYAAGMSNGSFTVTRTAVTSGGGIGPVRSFSESLFLRASTIAETAHQTLSGGSFELEGGFLSQMDELEQGLMRIHVKGTVDDLTATLYVNEICAVTAADGTWIAAFVTVEEGDNELRGR